MIGGDVAKKVDYACCSFEKQLPIDGCYAGTQTRGLKDGEAYAYLENELFKAAMGLMSELFLGDQMGLEVSCYGSQTGRLERKISLDRTGSELLWWPDRTT